MGLGKGLSALISEDTMSDLNKGHAYIPNLPVDQIKPNPYQPRVEIKPESLVELADSIREHGVIEPLIVTKKNAKTYELVAGERRWRAAKLAKLDTVPVVIKEASPQQMLELAVVENIQRADLNPLEEAMAFDQLQKMFGLKHADISTKVGFSRSAVANKIRLLMLPDEIKKMLLEETIDEGHARAILGLNNTDAMVATANLVVHDQLSVRAVEELVRRLNQGTKKPQKGTKRILDDYTNTIESSLRKMYGERLQLYRTRRGGKIVIPFESDKQLEKIYKTLVG
ncbi:MAG: ParB/RepB/Spo0J family partition protein [Candidatus Dojkabacteria bacterium]